MNDEPRRRRKLSAIMMADASGFSRMMGVDEEDTVDRIQAFHEHVRALVEKFEGRVVDTAGDSVFGEFDSVVNAMSCALAIQQSLARLNDQQPENKRIQTRIGVHLGDVIVEDYRVYGDGVNIAARLEPIADPGGICISEAVYQQVRAKLAVDVQDLGLRELKNIQHPVRVFKVPPLQSLVSQSPTAQAPSDISRLANAPELTPRASPGWRDTATLVLLSIGAFLIASPVIVFDTGGVFPTAGAILLAVGLARAWPDTLLLLLGLAIASGAWWTDWSRITNGLFLLGGIVVMAVGLGQRDSSKTTTTFHHL